MRALVLRSVAIAAAFSAGCFSAELDPELSGVFACETNDDCFQGRQCIADVCTTAPRPELMILSPESLERVGAPGSGTIELTISLLDQAAAPLALVVPGTPAVPGEGYIELFVDGELVETIFEGDSGSTLRVRTQLAATAGGHRIRARAVLGNGEPYPAADVRRVVWVEEEGSTVPRVTIVSPWPGEEFSTMSQELEVVVATRNFSLVPTQNAEETGSPHGHAHVYYDAPFPACALDDECADSYIALLTPAEKTVLMSTTFRLPPGSEDTAEVTVTLNNDDHSLFSTADAGVVFDEVPIRRRATAAP